MSAIQEATGEKVSPKVISELISAIDADKTGQIDFDEFWNAFKTMKIEDISAKDAVANVLDKWMQYSHAADSGNEFYSPPPPSGKSKIPLWQVAWVESPLRQ